MKKKTTRKRNPQDSTLRNIRALKKRIIELEKGFAEILGYLRARSSYTNFSR